MSELLVVTNRKLCRGDFLEQIEKLAAAHPKGILLREKDLTAEEYRKLAGEVLAICNRYGTCCVLHSFATVAAELHAPALHLPLPLLRTLTEAEKSRFPVLGTSCHSERDAREAEGLGCTYLTAGHVFDTECKKGLPGRGLQFLKEICDSVSIPVYAIGGIAPNRMVEVRRAGAAGGCVMSGAMTCDNAEEYVSAFEGVKDKV